MKNYVLPSKSGRSVRGMHILLTQPASYERTKSLNPSSSLCEKRKQLRMLGRISKGLLSSGRPDSWICARKKTELSLSWKTSWQKRSRPSLSANREQTIRFSQKAGISLHIATPATDIVYATLDFFRH